MKIAIIGATGVVGSTILKLLETRSVPYTSLRCFASAKSVGKHLFCNNRHIPIEHLDEKNLSGSDLFFFCAGSAISRKFIPFALSLGSTVIDASSAFRADPTVPLIIPEINGELLHQHPKCISSPNCAATLLLMPLFPLHKLFGVKRVITATYQAASGGGSALMEKLKRETHAYFKNEKETEHTYAFNLYLHDSPMGLDGYSEEENKIREEVRKILQDDEISLSATCVRVPVLRAHSLFANIECKTKISLREAQEAITHMSGVTYLKKNATPLHASGKNEIFCSRIRIDPSRPNTIEFWAVGDQLLKGAALNCVQIAEKLDGLAK